MQRQNITFKFIARAKGNGSASIYLAIYQRGNKNTKISLALPVLKSIDEFDADRQRVKKSNPSSLPINSALNRFEQKCIDVLAEWRRLNIAGSIDLFKRQVFSEDSGKVMDFYTFASRHLLSSTYNFNTVKTYRALISTLREYSPELYLHNITHDWLVNFRNYLVKQRKLHTNTVAKRFNNLRTIYLAAARSNEKLVPGDAFKFFKIERKDTVRQYLSIEELDQLQQLYDAGTLPGHLQNVLRYFLFSCYSGMRYGDLITFCQRNIMHGEIVLQTSKTEAYTAIPLNRYMKALLPDDRTGNTPYFDVLTNQKTNKNLKQILELAGIHKNITFHCARHTFATAALTYGMSIETVGGLLAQKDIRSTRIYAKLTNTKVRKEMELWGKK